MRLKSGYSPLIREGGIYIATNAILTFGLNLQRLCLRKENANRRKTERLVARGLGEILNNKNGGKKNYGRLNKKD
jgi:hypothetical protein